MRTRITLGAIAFAVASLAGSPSRAACPTPNTVPIKLLSAGFEAWKSVTATMAQCGNFSAELDQDFAVKQPAALATNPALYQIAGVSNDSIVAVLDGGELRPLDDLVAKYGQSLSPNQIIKLNGKTMVIAMMVNAQVLQYRKDVLDQLGIAVPKTWDEVLTAAEKIKQAKVVDYPLAATWKSGWNIGLDFVNLYMGMGGEFFGDGNTPAIHNAKGVATLELMKKLSTYMEPDYLSDDSTRVQQQFQQGKVAMSNLWTSRAGAMDDPKESKVVGKVFTAPAPLAVAGGKPATTMWWDGAAIAKNTSDAQAEAAFKLIVAGMSPEMVAAHNNDAVWVIRGFKPSRLAEGAITSLREGAPPYPVSSRMGMIHTAIGNNVAAFLTGKATADQTLAAAEASYTTAAKEAGLIK